jgi:hypothetical protein
VTHRISRNTSMASGIAAAILLLWFVTTGDTASGARLKSDPEALKLLRGAEGAARTTPYEGTQFITAWSRSGMATTSLVKVVHVPGDGTHMLVQSTTADQGGQMFEADDSQRTGGLTGYTPKMLDLLVRNYAVVRAGQGEVSGRPTSVIEARRADGTAAGRFHIDRQTGLMLRRELLDQQGREVNLTFFTEIRSTLPRARFVTASAPRTVEAPWPHQLAGADLGALRYHGWPVHSTVTARWCTSATPTGCRWSRSSSSAACSTPAASPTGTRRRAAAAPSTSATRCSSVRCGPAAATCSRCSPTRHRRSWTARWPRCRTASPVSGGG